MVAVIVSLECISCVTVAPPSAPGLDSLDPTMRIGQLKNGMRYYLLESNNENKVEMRLVVHAGSLMETDTELGLAHLVEHMEFQGTAHFAGQEIIDFLESNGMKFGPEVNAVTSFTNTQYFIDLPSENTALLKKGLSILDDWAHGPQVDPALLENEKNVIAEESRVRYQNVQSRMQLSMLDAIFSDTAYENRMPIGDIKQVRNFKAKDIEHFVDTWYTPDNMSIVIVGQFYPDEMESMLQTAFTDNLPQKSPRRKSPEAALSAVQKDSVHYFKDPDLGVNILVWWKVAEKVATDMESSERWDMTSGIAVNAFNRRLTDMALRPDSAFMQAQVQISWSEGHNREFVYLLVPCAGKEKEAVTAFMTEIKRLADHGITQKEFDVGKKAWHDETELWKTQRNNIGNQEKSTCIAATLVSDMYYPYTDTSYFIRQRITNEVGQETVNNWIVKNIKPTPAKFFIVTMDKPEVAVPDGTELLAIRDQVLESAVTDALQENTNPVLLSEQPTPGQIVKAEVIPGTPFRRWYLSNGIQIYLYRNTLTNNDFLLKAFSPGGLSTLSDEDYKIAQFCPYIFSQNGAGNFSAKELQEFLSGKRASVGLQITEDESVISGISDPDDPDDMERFFKLLYAQLVYPRRDSATEQTMISNLTTWYKNNEHTPSFLYSNEINGLTSNYAARTATATAAEIEKFNPDQAFSVRQRLFGNATDFTFIIMGSYHEAELKTLVERWLASIPCPTPTTSETRAPVDRGIRPAEGPVVRTVRAGTENKADVSLLMYTPHAYSAVDVQRAAVLKEIMDIRLRRLLRQEMGGTYSVDTAVSLTQNLYPHAMVAVRFVCDPEKQQTLRDELIADLTSLASGEISDEVFTDALEIRKSTIADDDKTNAGWLNRLYDSLVNTGTADDLDLKALTASIQKQDIAELAGQIIKPDKALTVILLPQ